MADSFLSALPKVRLLKSFASPVRNAAAAARTCYSSKGIVEEDSLEDREAYLDLTRSCLAAGHHTVFQHAYYQFAIENVSRQFLWSFLHAHPFYNSEQVSQRYVAVHENGAAVPALRGQALDIYQACLRRQFADYLRLRELLTPAAEAAFRKRFPRSPGHEKAHAQAIRRRAQEVARYILPVASHAYLYHTVSALTLLRYVRASRQLDAPTESSFVAQAMLQEAIQRDPDLAELAQRPLEPERFPESPWMLREDLFGKLARQEREKAAAVFLEEFERDFRRLGPRRSPRTEAPGAVLARWAIDRDLFPGELRQALGFLWPGARDAAERERRTPELDRDTSTGPGAPAPNTPEGAANPPGAPDVLPALAEAGGELPNAATADNAFLEHMPAAGTSALEGIRASRLIAWQSGAEKLLARAVRQVLGLPAASMSDGDAIALALDPERNPLLGDSLGLGAMSKISRALAHPHYTFLKRLSHTADSQDQRHRMVPGSRPFLTAHLTGQPDYITPALIEHCPRAADYYRDAMARVWKSIRALRRLNVPDEWTAYLLPNAATVRLTESADLLNLRHKLTSRLCLNSQEEIRRASIEEAAQIAEVHPRLGPYLAPPCSQRMAAGLKPFCPEGPRFCGVRVWTLPHGEWGLDE